MSSSPIAYSFEFVWLPLADVAGVTGPDSKTCVLQLQLRDLSLARFLRGHVAPVQAVAYSPDPRYVASGASDGVVMVSPALCSCLPCSAVLTYLSCTQIWGSNPKSRPWTLHRHTVSSSAC